MDENRDFLEDLKNAVDLLKMVGVETLVFKELGKRTGVRSYSKQLESEIKIIDSSIKEELDKLPRAELRIKRYKIVKEDESDSI